MTTRRWRIIVPCVFLLALLPSLAPGQTGAASITGLVVDETGGALPGVPSGASQASSVASGQGVLGSQAAAGVSSGNNSTSRGTSNATVAQVGPVTANLDPSIQESTACKG